jgi:hypothetical protein
MLRRAFLVAVSFLTPSSPPPDRFSLASPETSAFCAGTRTEQASRYAHATKISSRPRTSTCFSGGNRFQHSPAYPGHRSLEHGGKKLRIGRERFLGGRLAFRRARFGLFLRSLRSERDAKRPAGQRFMHLLVFPVGPGSVACCRSSLERDWHCSVVLTRFTQCLTKVR